MLHHVAQPLKKAHRATVEHGGLHAELIQMNLQPLVHTNDADSVEQRHQNRSLNRTLHDALPLSCLFLWAGRQNRIR